MKTFTISNEQVLSSNENLKVLDTKDASGAPLIKLPGLFSLKTSRIRKHLRDEAETILAERGKIVDEFTQYEGEGDDKKPVPVIDETTGKQIPNSVKLTNVKEFQAREKALLEGKVDISVPAVTEADFKDIVVPDAFTSALLPFVE